MLKNRLNESYDDDDWDSGDDDSGANRAWTTGVFGDYNAADDWGDPADDG